MQPHTREPDPVQYSPFNPRPGRRPSANAEAGVGAFMGTVYAWMTAGLALSAGTAYWLSQQPELLTSLFTGGMGIVLLLVPFILIFVLAARIEKGSLIECGFWYFLMTGIMGTWLTGIAVQASEDPAFASTVFQSLGITGAMFGGMSITGWITRKDLSGMGNFFLAALWGLIAVGFVNFYFVQSVGLSIAYHIVGVVLFAGLTAYDTQKIKQYYYSHGAHHGLAIWGALSLYLDFINLFLHILRLFGLSGSDD
jgi:FtsH-binding integral membrane protein